jgi:hypothetical protein
MLIWIFNKNIFMNNIYTVIIGGMVSTFSYVLSKIMKIQYTVPENPIGILGLLLNLASLFFIPFNFIFIFKAPEYLLISLATITGAHFFPYAWFYKTKWYAIFAGEIVIGIFVLGIALKIEKIYFMALYMFISLGIMAAILYKESINKQKNEPGAV